MHRDNETSAVPVAVNWRSTFLHHRLSRLLFERFVSRVAVAVDIVQICCGIRQSMVDSVDAPGLRYPGGEVIRSKPIHFKY